MKIELRNLTYAYPSASVPTLNALSLEFGDGEFWAIAGPNGSGKSTLLKAIGGFSEMESVASSVFVDGAPLAQLSRAELSKKIAFVPSQPDVRFPITVWNFALQGRFPHVNGLKPPAATDIAAVERVLERAGILEWKNRDVRELSTGERQLVVFARALAQDTKLLLLDESVANLDLKVQRRILDLLRERNTAGVTILLVTHDLNLIGEQMPKTLWLKSGKVVASGTTKDIFTAKAIGETFDVAGQIEIQTNPRSGRPQLFWA